MHNGNKSSKRVMLPIFLKQTIIANYTPPYYSEVYHSLIKYLIAVMFQKMGYH